MAGPKFVGDVPRNVDSLVIDVSHMAHRYAHALKSFRSSEGLLTGHVFGSFRGVKSLYKALKPKNLVFVYDRGCMWRRALVPEYKTGRNSIYQGGAAIETALAAPGEIRVPIAPPSFTPAFDVERLLRGFPAVHLSAPDCEADDMAAWYVNQRTHHAGSIVLFTGDKDYYALVSKTQDVKVLSSAKEKGKAVYRYIDEPDVEAEFGCAPWQVAYLKAILGHTADVSDSIPGIQGASRPGKLEALRQFALREEAYFDPSKTPSYAGVPEWLVEPLQTQRQAIINNFLITQMGTRVPNQTIVKTKADPANMMGILVEFECESLLEQVVPLLDEIEGVSYFPSPLDFRS